MQDGNITKFDLERMINAVEDDMIVVPLDEPMVKVKNISNDPPTEYTVDLDALNCDCPDYQYNCDDGEYCKHIYFAAFKSIGLI